MLTLEGLENWYTQTVKLKHAFAGTTAPDPIPLPDVTNVDGLLEGIVNETEEAFVSAADSVGALHGDDVVYKLTLPDKLYRWYGVKKVGGKTLLLNQAVDEATIDLSTQAQVQKTLTDHVIHFRGTATGTTATVFISAYNMVKDHIYAATLKKAGSDTVARIRLYDNTHSSNIFNNTSDTGWKIVTATQDCSARYYFQATNGMVVDTYITPLLIDLTTMFGAGNEPTTAEEFTAMFPLEYYAYGNVLMDTKVTSIISKGVDDTVLETVNVPAGVQALTGYGMSCPGAYNYIDFERKVFVQNVGAVDLGGLTFGYGPTVGWSATLPNVKDPADDDAVFNGISDNYTAVSRNTQATAFAGGTDAGMISVAGGKVYVGTGDISIVPSGTLYYELDEPVETSITITGTDIAHEAGGSITFENTNKIPVHVNVDYIGVHLS